MEAIRTARSDRPFGPNARAAVDFKVCTHVPRPSFAAISHAHPARKHAVPRRNHRVATSRRSWESKHVASIVAPGLQGLSVKGSKALIEQGHCHGTFRNRSPVCSESQPNHRLVEKRNFLRQRSCPIRRNRGTTVPQTAIVSEEELQSRSLQFVCRSSHPSSSRGCGRQRGAG